MAAAPVHTRYHIGTPDKPWGPAERAQWVSEQTKKRDYFTDVVSPLLRFTGGEVFQYGTLDYRKFGASIYPLYAVKSLNWDPSRPMALVTGGVHGYETSGVHGALLFIKDHFQKFSEKLNVLVLPCISPWGYETINRWTPEAVDPNRSFDAKKPLCPEAANAMSCTMMHAQQCTGVLMHADLHETTDSDNSEFTPAKAARDGDPIPVWEPIPDGFYLVGAELRPEVEWQEAMIAAVAKVTPIAPDDDGCLIGVKVTKPGLILLPPLFLCGVHTSAKYSTTTEVYPDSKRTNPEECNRAQVACVVSGLEYALQHQ